MTPDIQAFIREKSTEIFEKVRGYREHLHANPELSYQEHETMKFVSEALTEIGIEHTTGVGDTGIVGIIRGAHHADDMACFGFRADLDALPMFQALLLGHHQGLFHL